MFDRPNKGIRQLTTLLSLTLLPSLAVAQMSVGSVRWDDTSIPDPLSAFDIKYSVFGSQVVRPDTRVNFFLTRDGGATGFPLASDTIQVRCDTGLPPNLCRGPIGEQRFTVRSFNMDSATRNALSGLCSPTTFELVAQFNGRNTTSLNAARLGQTILPDWSITAGSMTPSTIPLDGTVSVEYSVRNLGCTSQVSLANVGIYLTDTSLNAIGKFGAIRAAGNAGSDHSFNLNFAGTNVPAGDYLIALFADDEQRIRESNENNNIGTFALRLVNSIGTGSDEQSPSDMTIETFLAPINETSAVLDGALSEELPRLKGLSIK